MGQGSSVAECAVGSYYLQDYEVAAVEGRMLGYDWTLCAPDECVAAVFQKLCLADRKECSLVCKRWHTIEGQGRQRLTLQAGLELGTALPAILHRFQHITKLALKCDRRVTSIDDEALCLVGHQCQQLRKLKLKACKGLTDTGIVQFARVCGPLHKISCSSCQFGPRGLNAILQYCSYLEDVTLKRLRGFMSGSSELVVPGCCSIRKLRLKDLPNAQLLGPLIAGSKSLHTLMLLRVAGNWDKLLEVITEHMKCLVEFHVEKVCVTDRGLQAVARWENLEVLYVVKPTQCTNYGLSAVAKGCQHLRKLHVEGSKSTRLGDEGLAMVARRCEDLQELVLIGLNVTTTSLNLLASNCRRLERLAICTSDTFGDLELSCIADKCLALKKLCIKNCPISDRGMEALVGGCPSLLKIKVKKCRTVSSASVAWLLTNRVALVVILDSTFSNSRPDAQVSWLSDIGDNSLVLCRLDLALSVA